MPDVTPPPLPNPEPSSGSHPVGRVDAAINAGTKFGRWVSGITPQQAMQLLAVILVGCMIVATGYTMRQSATERQDDRAFLIRSYESAEERGRLFYASEREKERQHCQNADERQRMFFVQEREKDRQSQNAFVKAVTDELGEWRRTFKFKGNEEEGTLFSLPRCGVPWWVPMPE